MKKENILFYYALLAIEKGNISAAEKGLEKILSDIKDEDWTYSAASKENSVWSQLNG